MTDHDKATPVPPLTLAWVGRHLHAGERVVRTEALHGGITADMRRLTIGTRDGAPRHLVLRSFIDPLHQERAEDSLHREPTPCPGSRGRRTSRLPVWSRSIRPPRTASSRRS